MDIAMTLITSDTSKATNFESLSFFRVYVDTPSESSRQISVFRNSRQQCRIRVAFIAVDRNNGQVHLTPAEIQEAVRLIRYVGGAEIPHENNFSDQHEWYSTFRDLGYVWEPSDMAAAQALQDDVDKVIADNLDIDHLPAFVFDDKSSRIRSLTSNSPEHHWNKAFFKDMVAEGRRVASAETKTRLDIQEPDSVATDLPILGSVDDEAGGLQEGAQVVTFLVATRAISSSPLAFAASIRSSTHGTFRTNHTEVTDPAGHGNGRGEFNSQVIVTSVAIPNYPISAFGDFLPVVDGDYVLRDHLVYGSATKLRAYEHFIKLTVNGKWIRLRSDITPGVLDPSIYNDVGDVGAEWCYSYMGEPGDTALWHSDRTIGYFNSGNNGSRQMDSRQLVSRVAPHGIHRPRAGEIVVGQIMSDDHWQIAGWDGRGRSRGSRSTLIRDEQGNAHSLRIYLPNGHYKFNYIAIAKE